MKNCIIRSFARPSNILLYLIVDGTTGKARFIARQVRSRQVENIDLSLEATEEILEELREKGVWNVRYGHTLMTVMVRPTTKKFIESCWDELKKLRPQFSIK